MKSDAEAAFVKWNLEDNEIGKYGKVYNSQAKERERKIPSFFFFLLLFFSLSIKMKSFDGGDDGGKRIKKKGGGERDLDKKQASTEKQRFINNKVREKKVRHRQRQCMMPILCAWVSQGGTHSLSLSLPSTFGVMWNIVGTLQTSISQGMTA